MVRKPQRYGGKSFFLKNKKIIKSRSPSRWKDDKDKDNLEINLLEDNDDVSLASRETDTFATDIFKRPRLPSGSYAGDTPVSFLP